MSRFDADAAAAAALGETGDVQLASLTREELRGVGDDPLLADAADALWWDALSEREQDLVLETAQRSLVARNLLVGGDDGAVDVTDEVRLVLAARTAPDWVVVLGEPSAERDFDEAPVQLALMALPSPSGDPAAVLVSARLEGIYLHRLVSTPTSFEVAADWLLRAAAVEGADVARTVEVLAPVGERLESARGLVVGRGAARRFSVVVDGVPGEPAPTDHDVLSRWLRDRVG
ncbi:hypothetical protein [Nocardioides mangrovicus]|uniref:hypothetical protein n=1 Tax=Nocardioides mangrovicus TaxID=2478913 RepID=UPI0011C4660F|nr:hypothetical protein [Nocardioides mangrovicus]